MKISIAATRRISRLLSDLSEEQSTQLLSPLGLEDHSQVDDRLSLLDDQFNGEWTTANFRKVWVAAELSNLFNSWVTAFKTESQKSTITGIKKKLIQINKNKLIALELLKKPKLFLLASSVNAVRTMNDKASTDADIRDSVYWLPELGIILTSTHNDDNGERWKTSIQKQITNEWESFRFISLIISRFYNENRMISKLVVSAIPEITGFNGLENITFNGEDVKAGLGGLHRRQDIRVHLDQVGPNIAASTENIDVKIGNKARIKNIEGFYVLKDILYPKKS
ncbi:MAG: hypothetical protein ACXAD7_14210 [Candidatus Kariarchaeaceae archaeon]|jgi:hypothetical protein